MGYIGMTVDDFCRCTPSEFVAVYEGWMESEQRREHADWERTRTQVTFMLQPYSKHALDPRAIFPFPWEKKEDGSETLSAKEIWENFNRAKEEQGLQ